MAKYFKRQRLESPTHFIPGSFRTIKESHGHELIVGKLKKGYRKHGYSSWHAQALLHKKNE